MDRRCTKILTWFMAAFLFFTQSIFTYTAFAGSSAELQWTRLSGSDRYKTAVAISKEGWDRSEYVVLARGDDFPDALCAGPLAAKYGAPILLTAPKALNPDALAEIKRLGAGHVIIVGGYSAVSMEVEKALKEAGIEGVDRVYGKNRYDTSVKIAERIGAGGVIALATGRNYPDTLSFSTIASYKKMPILLTDKDSLPEEVESFMERNNIEKTYIIGGPGVISEDVKKLMPGDIRLGGSNRYETNVEVIREFEDEIDFGRVYLTVGQGSRGNEFADALTGSVLAAKTTSPALLVSTYLPGVIGDYIKDKISVLTKVTVLGGTSAVPQSVVDDFLELLEGGEGFEVHKVEATTDMVDQWGGERLKFTINGGYGADVEDLEDQGYEVEFQSTSPVFINGYATSRTGRLRDDLKDAGKAAGERFLYKVVVYKDGKVAAESSLKGVDVVDYSSTASRFISAELVFGAEDQWGNPIWGQKGDQVFVEAQSSKLVIGETAYIRDIKAELLDGYMDRLDDFEAHRVSGVEFSSSNKKVAVIDGSGKITPISEGDVTFTLRSGNAVMEISAQVVKDKRRPSWVEVDKTFVRLTRQSSMEIWAAIKDQYGDPYPGYELDNVEINNRNDQLMAVVDEVIPSNRKSDEKGVIRFSISDYGYNPGKGNLVITDKGMKSPGGIPEAICSIPVEVEHKDDSVTERNLELKYTKDDLKLDLNHEEDSSLTLVYREYDKNGRFIRKIKKGDYSNLWSYWTVKSSNEDVAVAELDFKGDIVVRALSPGTASIRVYNGGIVEDTMTVTVVDSMPEVNSVIFENVSFTSSSESPVDFHRGVLKPVNIKINSPEIIVPVYMDGAVEYRVGGESGRVLAVAKVAAEIRDKQGGDVEAAIALDLEDMNRVKLGKVVNGTLGNFEYSDKGVIIVTLYKADGRTVIDQLTIGVNN